MVVKLLTQSAQVNLCRSKDGVTLLLFPLNRMRPTGEGRPEMNCRLGNGYNWNGMSGSTTGRIPRKRGADHKACADVPSLIHQVQFHQMTSFQILPLCWSGFFIFASKSDKPLGVKKNSKIFKCFWLSCVWRLREKKRKYHRQDAKYDHYHEGKVLVVLVQVYHKWRSETSKVAKEMHNCSSRVSDRCREEITCQKD